jgi:hypothetical protein
MILEKIWGLSMSVCNRFWAGFEKMADSILGSMPGMMSGTRMENKGDKITPAPIPNPNVSMIPRSSPPKLPTPVPVAADKNRKTFIPERQAKITVPKPSNKVKMGN